MNRYKLTALIGEEIEIYNIDDNTREIIYSDLNEKYYLRCIIRDDINFDIHINFKSEMSIKEIVEILSSKDKIIVKMFIDIIKNQKL